MKHKGSEIQVQNEDDDENDDEDDDNGDGYNDWILGKDGGECG